MAARAAAASGRTRSPCLPCDSAMPVWTRPEPRGQGSPASLGWPFSYSRSLVFFLLFLCFSFASLQGLEFKRCNR
jgi:hypothetical protein